MTVSRGSVDKTTGKRKKSTRAKSARVKKAKPRKKTGSTTDTGIDVQLLEHRPPKVTRV